VSRGVGHQSVTCHGRSRISSHKPSLPTRSHPPCHGGCDSDSISRSRRSHSVREVGDSWLRELCGTADLPLEHLEVPTSQLMNDHNGPTGISPPQELAAAIAKGRRSSNIHGLCGNASSRTTVTIDRQQQWQPSGDRSNNTANGRETVVLRLTDTVHRRWLAMIQHHIALLPE
jgi:hypothetical protein